jgi:hypothetical protein
MATRKRAPIAVPKAGLIDDLDKKLAPATEKPAATTETGPKRRYAGTYRTTLYIPEAVHEVVRQIAFDHRVKEHDLFLRGIELMLAEHGYELNKIK